MAEQVVETRDEHGNRFDFLQFEDVFLPKSMVKNLLGGQSIEQRLNQLSAIRYQKGDVLVCSYPKSGTHWINNIVHLLMNTDMHTVSKSQSVAPVFLDIFPEESWISLPNPRILTTHVTVDRLPVELKQKAKIVYVLRNPKDICTSLFYFCRWSQVDCQQSWDAVVQRFLQGPISFGTYTDYLLKLQHELGSNPAFKPCIIFYEDLKKNGIGELRKLQRYLGLNHSDSLLEAILDRCDVNKLKYDVDEGKVETILIDKDKKSVVYRKGEIGDWRNHFTVAQNEAFDHFWSEKMADSMFKFKYE